MYCIILSLHSPSWSSGNEPRSGGVGWKPTAMDGGRPNDMKGRGNVGNWTFTQGERSTGNIPVSPQLALSFPFPLWSCSDSSFPSSSCRLAGADGPGFELARCLPLRTTISFNHVFSRRRSAASCSSSSVLPVKSVTVRSRSNALSFFLTLNRAEAAVFLRRLSSAEDTASSDPSKSCTVGVTVAREAVGCGGPAPTDATCGGTDRGRG